MSNVSDRMRHVARFMRNDAEAGAQRRLPLDRVLVAIAHSPDLKCCMWIGDGLIREADQIVVHGYGTPVRQIERAKWLERLAAQVIAPVKYNKGDDNNGINYKYNYLIKQGRMQ